MMGCNQDVDNNCHSDYRQNTEGYYREFPYHEVDVAAFWIHTYQVTLDYYAECVGQGPCTAAGTSHADCNARYGDRLDHPVNCVTWYQSRAFCAWAGMRLCTEAEWEKAARGTDGRRFPWGNEMVTCTRAVFEEAEDGCGRHSTWPVGSKPDGVSPYGVHDMAGNLFDWVEDEWHADYEGAPTDGSAWVDNPNAELRMRRGGSFYDRWYLQRTSVRYDGRAPDPVGYTGFRCCMDHEPPD